MEDKLPEDESFINFLLRYGVSTAELFLTCYICTLRKKNQIFVQTYKLAHAHST